MFNMDVGVAIDQLLIWLRIYRYTVLTILTILINDVHMSSCIQALLR